jgi:hypothetical protein
MTVGELPFRDEQSEHYPRGNQCKCGWRPMDGRGENLLEHVYEAQMQELDDEWSSY